MPTSEPNLGIQYFCPWTLTRRLKIQMFREHLNEVRLSWQKCENCSKFWPTAGMLKSHLTRSHGLKRSLSEKLQCKVSFNSICHVFWSKKKIMLHSQGSEYFFSVLQCLFKHSCILRRPLQRLALRQTQQWRGWMAAVSILQNLFAWSRHPQQSYQPPPSR